MKNRITLASFFIVLLNFVVYSNTFHAEWQFDDYHNIVNSQSAHLNELSVENVIRSLSSDYSNNLFRAFPRLSFALNWYFGKDNVVGYHLVNIVVHCITSIVLFFLILNILDVVCPRKEGNFDIAVISTLIWALHPIQISAVTYIVQRMASMAAMFYLCSMLFYVLGRKSQMEEGRIEYGYFSLSVACFIFAIFSKENAAMLPLSILLMEILIFKNPIILDKKSLIFKIGVLLIAIVFFLLIYFIPDTFFNLFLYDDRPFNAYQRLLTEFRVIVFYLSLIFFPLTSRFSIEHYFNSSISIVNPLNTLICFCVIVLLLAAAYSIRKKQPIWAFALFFYFLNHLIESSFLGLELAFEHRNYLPTAFLFIPVALFLHALVTYTKRSKRLFGLFTICFLIFTLGVSTYHRNSVWEDLGGLWRDALNKSPASGRVLLNYAVLNLVEEGKFKDALECFIASKNMGWHQRNNSNSIPYSKISQLLKTKGQYDSALIYARKAILGEPDNEIFMRDFLILALYNKVYRAADFACDILLKAQPGNYQFLNYKGFISLKEEEFLKSLYYFRKSLRINQLNEEAMVNAGYALHRLGNYKQADTIFNMAQSLYPENTEICYQLLNNSLAAGNTRKEIYINRMLKRFSWDQIINDLEDRTANPLILKIDTSAIVNSLIARLKLG